jgi:hypothetical protein
MEQQEFELVSDVGAVTLGHVEASRASVPAVVTTSGTPAPAATRHLFTMTVDHVAAELYRSGFPRDERTIQRWCKSGKLDVLIDQEHGDRYLINPASVATLVAGFIKERDMRATMPSRQFSDVDAPSRHSYADTPAQPHATTVPPHDTAETNASTSSRQNAATTDEVTKLRKRVEELEREKVMLTVDKQVREKMVSYMEERFGQILDDALDRSTEVGHLRAQVYQLRAMLPPGADTSGIVEYQPHRFTPRHVLNQRQEGRGEPDQTVHRAEHSNSAWGV